MPPRLGQPDMRQRIERAGALEGRPREFSLPDTHACVRTSAWARHAYLKPACRGCAFRRLPAAAGYSGELLPLRGACVFHGCGAYLFPRPCQTKWQHASRQAYCQQQLQQLEQLNRLQTCAHCNAHPPLLLPARRASKGRQPCETPAAACLGARPLSACGWVRVWCLSTWWLPLAGVLRHGSQSHDRLLVCDRPCALCPRLPLPAPLPGLLLPSLPLPRCFAPLRWRPGGAARRGVQGLRLRLWRLGERLSCRAAGCGGPYAMACNARRHPCKRCAAGTSYWLPRAPECTRRWISCTLAHGGQGPSPSAGLVRHAVHVLDMAPQS